VYSKIALAKVAKVAKILRSHGYHSAAWQDFNTSLIAVGRRRFSGNTNVMLGVKYLASDVVSSLPPAGGDPRSAFFIWTLICFLLGAVCSLGTAFGSSSLWFALLRLLVLVVAGYAVAYTLYFVFVATSVVPWMRAGLVFLAAYALVPLIVGPLSLMLILTTSANVVLLLHAQSFYKRALALGADSAYAYVYLDDGTPDIGVVPPAARLPKLESPAALEIVVDKAPPTSSSTSSPAVLVEAPVVDVNPSAEPPTVEKIYSAAKYP